MVVGEMANQGSNHQLIQCVELSEFIQRPCQSRDCAVKSGYRLQDSGRLREKRTSPEPNTNGFCGDTVKTPPRTPALFSLRGHILTSHPPHPTQPFILFWSQSPTLEGHPASTQPEETKHITEIKIFKLGSPRESLTGKSAY